MSDKIAVKLSNYRLAHYNRLLAMCSEAGAQITGLRSVVEERPTENDLDRGLADDTFLSEINTASASDGSHPLDKLLDEAADYQEEQRTRRDTRVALSTHKDLMLAYLKMLYGAKRQLEIEVDGSLARLQQ